MPDNCAKTDHGLVGAKTTAFASYAIEGGLSAVV